MEVWCTASARASSFRHLPFALREVLGVLGMCTKYSDIVIALHHRRRMRAALSAPERFQLLRYSGPARRAPHFESEEYEDRQHLETSDPHRHGEY